MKTIRPTDQELQGIKLFDTVNLSDIQDYIQDCPVHCLKKDEVLLEEGQVDGRLYFILSGSLRIQLQKKSSQSITVLEAGESVGEVSIIDQQPCSGFVIASDDTRLLVLDEETLWDIVRKSHAVSYNLLRILAYRMRFGSSVMYRIQTMLKEYEYEATIDPLTGFYNRRWLSKMLPRLMQRTCSGEASLSVIMMDLDYFKNFNDRYGHIAGDRALSSISTALTEHMRPEDSIARYGGEEFLAVLPGSDQQDAMHIAERLRQAVEETQVIAVDGESLGSLTLSLGIAEMSKLSTPDSLVGAADSALYRAKHAGRNQVSF